MSIPSLLTLFIRRLGGPHLGMPLVEVQGGAGIFNRRVLPFLDAQPQDLESQVPEGTWPWLSPKSRRPHQRREARSVANLCERMAEQQRLPASKPSIRGWTAGVKIDDSSLKSEGTQQSSS